MPMADNLVVEDKVLHLELEQEIEKSLYSLSIAEPLKAAIHYTLFPGGKRIRPLLSLAILNDCNVQRDKFMPVAGTLELIHNASLIHDDLPALDNDAIRRGRPTCHKVFGEATAVLAGDFMVSAAVSLLTKTAYKPEVQVRMVSALSLAYNELCNGQQLDMLANSVVGNVETTHRLKTGALFSCAAELPVLAAEYSSSSVERARHFGSQFGLFFQMSDDFIDLFGSEEARGRPESSDIKNKKTTAFLNQDLEEARLRLKRVYEDLESSLKALSASLGLSDMPQTRQIIEKVIYRLNLSGNDINVAQNS